MKQNIVLIDGKAFNFIIPENGIKRSFEIVDTDKAGRLITGTMQRDIIGTYYNYSIEFRASSSNLDEYDEFYELISSPVDSHVIVVPYGQNELTFNAYVTNGSDMLKCRKKDKNKWYGLNVNFIAIAPERRPL